MLLNISPLSNYFHTIFILSPKTHSFILLNIVQVIEIAIKQFFRFFQAEVTLLFFHIKCLFMIQPKSCTMIFIDPEYVIKRYGRYYHFLRLIYFSTSFKLIIGNDSSFFFLFTTLLKHFFFFFSFLQKRRYRQSKFTLRRCIRWIFPPNICAYPFCTYAAVSEIRPVNSGNVDKK